MPFAMIGFVLGCLYYKYSLQHLSDSAGSLSHVETLDTRLLLYKLICVIVCMITARNAAMAFNRYIDRKYDEKNPRTAIREIPSGIITPKNALLFVLINCAVFILATWFINKLCFFLSPVALAVILGYSLTKRFTFLCHMILGIGLGLAPIGAFLAVAGHFAVTPVLFSFAVFSWVSGFDIIYALQDEQFDKENLLYSIPSYFGQEKAKWIARILHVLAFAFILFIGFYGNFSLMYWLGCVVFGSLLLYQHYIVYRYGMQKIDLAFFTMNGIASILFGLCVITDIIMHF